MPHTVIPDNSGGHLMQHGKVDMVIVGTDRTTAYGDVCNKIGTYLKALAAHDNGIPFYVARTDARGAYRDCVHHLETVSIIADGSPVANHAFDVTPTRLVTALITEHGVVAAEKQAIEAMFPERVVAEPRQTAGAA